MTDGRYTLGVLGPGRQFVYFKATDTVIVCNIYLASHVNI